MPRRRRHPPARGHRASASPISMGNWAAGNPLAARLRAIREYLMDRGAFDPRDRRRAVSAAAWCGRRASGSYYAAREACNGGAADFGYELIERRLEAAISPSRHAIGQDHRTGNRTRPHAYGGGSQPPYQTNGLLPPCRAERQRRERGRRGGRRQSNGDGANGFGGAGGGRGHGGTGPGGSGLASGPGTPGGSPGTTAGGPAYGYARPAAGRAVGQVTELGRPEEQGLAVDLVTEPGCPAAGQAVGRGTGLERPAAAGWLAAVRRMGLGRPAAAELAAEQVTDMRRPEARGNPAAVRRMELEAPGGTGTAGGPAYGYGTPGGSGSPSGTGMGGGGTGQPGEQHAVWIWHTWRNRPGRWTGLWKWHARRHGTAWQWFHPRRQRRQWSGPWRRSEPRLGNVASTGNSPSPYGSSGNSGGPDGQGARVFRPDGYVNGQPVAETDGPRPRSSPDGQAVMLSRPGEYQPHDIYEPKPDDSDKKDKDKKKDAKVRRRCGPTGPCATPAAKRLPSRGPFTLIAMLIVS